MSPKKNKQVVMLNGSPRPRGNTQVLVGWMEEEFSRRGWKVLRYDLYQMKFRGCAHCDHCKSVKNRPGCRLADDLIPVLEKVAASPVLVVASPVYCWKFSGCLSAALDRFYSLFKEGGSLIRAKRVAGVFTAGGDAFDGMDLCVESLRRICEYGSAEYLGTLGATLCDTPRQLQADKKLRRQAAELVGELCGA